MPEPTAEVLAALAAALRPLGLGWYVQGGQAVALHGRPRLTEDVDVTVLASPDTCAPLVRALLAAGFVPRVPELLDFAQQTWILPLEHRPTGLPVDVVLGASAIEADFEAGAVEVELGGARVPFLSAADLVVAKLLAGRPKDLDDATSVLAAQALDLGAIRAVLARLEVALDHPDLLRLLDEARARARR